MTDQELSTRDLAGIDEPDSSTESDARSRSPIPAEALRDAQERDPVSSEDEPLGRERSQDDDRQGDDDRGLVQEATEPSRRTAGSGDAREPLLSDDQSERFTTRWQEIQASFVDQPREAVANADALVADLMQRLAAGFSSERERLEGQWDRGDEVSTEELRVALTRYRSFFDRLLSA
jgi:hypothetical protein